MGKNEMRGYAFIETIGVSTPNVRAATRWNSETLKVLQAAMEDVEGRQIIGEELAHDCVNNLIFDLSLEEKKSNPPRDAQHLVCFIEKPRLNSFDDIAKIQEEVERALRHELLWRRLTVLYTKPTACELYRSGGMTEAGWAFRIFAGVETI